MSTTTGEWKTLLAIDADRWAAATYAANFPGVRVECGPVVNYIDALPAADVLMGGPPCQPFSTAGEGKGEDDARDCIPDFLSAIRKVRPRMFLMENVPGLLNERHSRYIGGVFTEMESAGYSVQARELDAVNFGVPQFRNRVWFWGIRSDVYAAGARHCWPKPTHAWPPPEECMFGAAMLPGVTVGQALGIGGGTIHRRRGEGMIERHGERRDTPVVEPMPTINAGVARQFHLQSHADPPVTVERPSPTLRSGGNGHDGCCLRILGGGTNPHYAGEARTERDITNEPSTTIAASHTHNALPTVAMEYDHGVALLDRPSPTIKAGGNVDASGKMGGGSPPILYHWSDAYLEKHPPASPASPAPTVRAQWAKGAPNGMLAVSEWKRKDELWVRRLAALECARLQSMPDDFRWPADIGVTHAYRVIGNGWASRMGAVFSDAFRVADPASRTVIDLFCGGGLGACGWHDRYWAYEPLMLAGGTHAL